MYPAFMGCVQWALGTDEIIKRYRDETGDKFEFGKSGIEQMVDQATGADFAFFQRFSDWVEREIFGTPEMVHGGNGA
ncbi:hypothetical protein [Phyllobacterium leguminum]|uniref:Uncharacterized protein n=1 Tax=Phyllobacterium leguminum TaxID=314237 RepID=A0A318TCG8_9HYPH|nr:hypothetical protein [Phyllobacterium leguminum]PYE88772.1 hypothetical protein C7477_106145 [Phyllobacterium leguminum]